MALYQIYYNAVLKTILIDNLPSSNIENISWQSGIYILKAKSSGNYKFFKLIKK